MNTITLIVYIIGAILVPIYMFLLWKHKRWNYTADDLLFSIIICWLSWIIVFLLFVEYISDITLFRFMTKDEYRRVALLCALHHHKVRQNKYGICWCVRCGLLINSSITFEPLKETDKLIIK